MPNEPARSETTLRPPTWDEADARIDLWHDGGCPPEWSLQQALGMTDAEYAVYVHDGSAVPARPLPEVPAT